MTNSFPASRIAELLAKARAQTLASSLAVSSKPTLIQPTAPSAPIVTPVPTLTSKIESEGITYNAEQQAFIDLATSGKSCTLIGAAGTGKTTCMKGVIQSLILSNRAGIYVSDGHSYLQDGAPGIVGCAFTRRAVQNLRKQMPENMLGNTITIHKLLEYRPEYYEVIGENGLPKNTMRFEPHRNKHNKLPPSIVTIIIEESSMVSVELYTEITNALSPDTSVQFIFLGDIQQLPPVFGSAILGFKLLDLPTIELTQVYRQALESPIIRLAHRILSGKPIPLDEYPDWNIPDQLKLHPWKKKLSADMALLTAAKFFTIAIDQNAYDPEEDIILIPYNVNCGTRELNKHIGNHLARKSGALTHEIIAGFNKHYLSVGDKVLYEKEDATVISINPNMGYVGKSPLAPSTTLDYWGHEHSDNHARLDTSVELDMDNIDAMLEKMSSSEERVQEASHLVTLRLHNSDTEVTLNTASEFNSLDFGWALTVHKSQGSEWERVFIVLHHSHNTMLQRELLYTACTRAKKSLYVICEPDTFMKGILSQKIKGNTLAEKAEYFKGKVASGNMQTSLLLKPKS
jgi:exodeoxyribonuclease V alpha subunit